MTAATTTTAFCRAMSASKMFGSTNRVRQYRLNNTAPSASASEATPMIRHVVVQRGSPSSSVPAITGWAASSAPAAPSQAPGPMPGGTATVPPYRID
jgi:hypothetical protein